jgi:Zn-dependent protease/CBS domain-containing protein
MSDQGSPPPRGRSPAVTGGGLQVGRVLGVPIVVQPLWFVIVVVIAASFGPEVQRQVPSLSHAASYAVSLVFVLLLYGSVLVHEISHVAVAKAFGMQVRRIVLQLLGGVSEVVEEQPGKPSREGLVAAVGPITSLILGLIGLAVARNLDHGTVSWLIAQEFAIANLFVAGFNALPGLPLDGGRVLRAVLWRVTSDKARGTLAAGWVGRALAVGVVGVAIAKPHGWGNTTLGALYLFVIAMFIWTNATIAIAQAKVTGVLPRLDIRSLTRRAMPVAAELPVAEAVRRAREAGARALVVVDGLGKPSGLVSEAAVSALPEQRQPWVAISDLARPVDPSLVLRTDMNGESLLQAVQSTPATEYLVVDNVGAICGVLSRIDLVAALQAAGLR